MLSLDISGAFDNVSHDRLIWVLRKKGFPSWILRFVRNFLTGRKTKITFAGYESDWIPTDAGIPQGSHLSPILFLFYISELLEDLLRLDGDSLAFGFVDDTNIVAWGPSAHSNCLRLELAHDKCIAWAKRYGVAFSPEKYKLIHFTRKRRNPSGDLASTVRINAHEIHPEAKLKVLGVLVDPKLSWKAHIQQAASKGRTAFEAMARITASTWGPSMRRSRLLYSAIARPAMLYGAQIWGLRDNGEPIAPSKLQPLKAIQNKCLRRIAGAYKRTPTAAVERETVIPPLDLYINAIAMQQATTTEHHQVSAEIKEKLDELWARERPHTTEMRRGRRLGRPRNRPDTGMEKLRARAREKGQEVSDDLRNEAEAQGRSWRRGGMRGHQHQWKATTLISRWLDREWKKRWMAVAQGKSATTWRTPWTQPVLRLYEGLQKHEATALFLLRTEVIGLNAWLAHIGVPDILPRCACGAQAQTVRHILLHCPDLVNLRAEMLEIAQTENLEEILSSRAGSQAAVHMLLRSGLLGQFQVANEIAKESATPTSPLRDLDSWT